MLEKRNTTGEDSVKDAAGDAGVLDDLVEMTAGKMERQAKGPRRRELEAARRAVSRVSCPVDVPETAVC